ncbi:MULTISPECIES: TIGR04211 family SH3 domain-containing protein [Methylophaga]|uniref:TIGR04211 family SH3 domain-containing protein n=2 Tax=Methylophaga TaxID=40222 RepID=A0ABN0TZJ3_9GAMM|nr:MULTISPECIES: TIGR04211 family SH3 domain-containing protein [Methylophaga]BDZ74099.1 signal transduction protein [Methylophaga marina]GLQ00329.1 signal transduction protein [Methylophaga thalassica]
MKKLIAHILISAALLTPVLAQAQTTRYVSDKLEITMRNGQGVKFNIRKMLESGTRLEVLETDPAGYSKVRTTDGVEGWVLTRYLTNTPSARDQLEASQKRVANLELEIAKYKEEISSLSNQNSDVDTQNMSLKEKSQRLSKELDDLRRTASNAVALDNENRQLKEKLQEIDHENQSLVIENNALKDNSTRSWFLIGAAVLFAGILLGIILPRLKVRKKDSWGSL